MKKALIYRREESHVSHIVRHGYFYRRLFESQREKYGEVKVMAQLGPHSPILDIIATILVTKVADPILDPIIKLLKESLMDVFDDLDLTTKKILEDKNELEKFCRYVMDYNDGRIAKAGVLITPGMRKEIVSTAQKNLIKRYLAKVKNHKKRNRRLVPLSIDRL